MASASAGILHFKRRIATDPTNNRPADVLAWVVNQRPIRKYSNLIRHRALVTHFHRHVCLIEGNDFADLF